MYILLPGVHGEYNFHLGKLGKIRFTNMSWEWNMWICCRDHSCVFAGRVHSWCPTCFEDKPACHSSKACWSTRAGRCHFTKNFFVLCCKSACDGSPVTEVDDMETEDWCVCVSDSGWEDEFPSFERSDMSILVPWGVLLGCPKKLVNG